MTKRVVIIGNGISGITAARHIRKKSDYKITVISAETRYFFSRTALMYVYMGHMKFEHTQPYESWFWKKNKINLLQAYVESIDFNARKLTTTSGNIDYDILIIATGSVPNKFGWPGQELEGVQGLYSYQDLERMEKYTQNIDHAVVVGGGLIGVEMAEMLHTRNIGVTFLVRESHFWGNILPKEEGNLVLRHLRDNGIDLKLDTELKEIVPDENGRARAVIDSHGDRVDCRFVGLTAGVKPNIDFLRDTELRMDRGILVDSYLKTNIPDVYCIGDCAQHKDPPGGRAPVEQVWYTGRMMGETVAKTITGTPAAYDPGPWFNSAKFFDIEYQTYGWVRHQLGQEEATHYWENDQGDKCVRFVWNESDGKLTGFNSFGIRWRHEVFDEWLRSGATIDTVMQDLHTANFDPEFYPRYESRIRESLNINV